MIGKKTNLPCMKDRVLTAALTMPTTALSVLIDARVRLGRAALGGGARATTVLTAVLVLSALALVASGGMPHPLLNGPYPH